MKANAMVTGPSGFLGSAVCRELVVAGVNVWAPTRRSLPFANVRLHELPIQDLSEVRSLHALPLRSVDCVVHCAGRAHQLKDNASDPLAAFRAINRDATLEVASAALAAGVKRFVFVSSIGVNGSTSGDTPFTADSPPQPDTPYAQSKWEAEQALANITANTGMELFIVRPPMIYGPGAPGNFALLSRLVRTGWPLPFGAMNAPRSFVALPNVADFIRHLVTTPGLQPGTYLVSDGAPLSTTRFVQLMKEAMGTRNLLIPVPVKWLERGTALVGRSDQVRKMAVPLAIDMTSTRKRLGWAPPWNVRDALRFAFDSTAV